MAVNVLKSLLKLKGIVLTVILILKIVCTNYGIPYCKRMEGTRFVKFV